MGRTARRERREGTWDGTIPEKQGAKLPKLQAKLKAKDPIRLVVNGVRENFKYGMLAAVQTVGAENDCRTLSDPIRALECGDAVVAVGLLFFHCVSSPVFVRLLGIITHYIVFSIPFFGLEVMCYLVFRNSSRLHAKKPNTQP